MFLCIQLDPEAFDSDPNFVILSLYQRLLIDLYKLMTFSFNFSYLLKIREKACWFLMVFQFTSNYILAL